MYHTLEFLGDLVLELAVSPRQPLERRSVRRGSRLAAQLKPYVVETADGPAEVADLFFEDGTSASGVPFACFTFVEA